MKYNSWPLGSIPKEMQRPEPEQLRRLGYKWDDPRDIVGIFEAKVAAWAGSKYAVAVDCCSNGLFLCLEYLRLQQFPITIPAHTYVSVPMQIRRAGYFCKFEHIEWSGAYQLKPLPVWDAAVRWTRGMYIPGNLMVLSFQIKKRVPIGRGGMVLTDDRTAYKWLKLASYDGRDLSTPYDSPLHVQQFGWHYYMTPEDAARGIILMDQVPDENPDQGGWQNYPKLTDYEIFR